VLSEDSAAAASSEASDFFIVEATDPEDAAAKVVRIVAEHIPARFGLDPIGIGTLGPENGEERTDDGCLADTRPSGHGTGHGACPVVVGITCSPLSSSAPPSWPEQVSGVKALDNQELGWQA
jgi:hypothetical protein